MKKVTETLKNFPFMETTDAFGLFEMMDISNKEIEDLSYEEIITIIKLIRKKGQELNILIINLLDLHAYMYEIKNTWFEDNVLNKQHKCSVTVDAVKQYNEMTNKDMKGFFSGWPILARGEAYRTQAKILEYNICLTNIENLISYLEEI